MTFQQIKKAALAAGWAVRDETPDYLVITRGNEIITCLPEGLIFKAPKMRAEIVESVDFLK